MQRPETEPVGPVDDRFVDAIKPHVPRRIWAMIELQRSTAMRPGEVCCMRTIDVNTSGRNWIYVPETHKTEHHGKRRRIILGPKAIDILRPWLRSELEAYLFSPAESEAERRSAQRQARKSPVCPCHQKRRKRTPKLSPGVKYSTESYRRAILNGIDRANRALKAAGGSDADKIPCWHPNQLRHSAATRIAREFGLDVASAVLGHSALAMTETYVEPDWGRAAEAMERIG